MKRWNIKPKDVKIFPVISLFLRLFALVFYVSGSPALMSRIRKIFRSPIFKLGFLIIFLILFFGYVRQAFFVRASDERVNIYPQAVSRENNSFDLGTFSPPDESLWQAGEKAFSVEVDPIAAFSAFNEEFSALLSFGSGLYENNTEIISTSTSLNPAAVSEDVGSSTEPIVSEDSGDNSAFFEPIDFNALEEDGEQSPSALEESSPDSFSDLPSDEIVPDEIVPEILVAEPAIEENFDEDEPASLEAINHFPSSGPAESAAPVEPSPMELTPSVIETSESQPSLMETGEAMPAPAILENNPAPETDSGSSAGAVPASLSFLDNLRIAKQGVNLFWKKLTFTPKVSAEENISASSTVDMENNPELPVLAAEYEDSLIFSNFDLGGYSSESEIVNIQLRLSMAAKSSFAFDHLRIEYSTGEGWQEAGNLFLKGGASNSLNGGYFLYALPLSFSWGDIDNLEIRVSYLNSEISKSDLEAKGAKVYLDGLWLEVDYSNGKVKGEKDLNNLDQDIIPGEEKRFFGEETLMVDGKEISFAYTDDNSGENLVIKSDQKDYTGLTQAEVYLSVTNRGETAENFGLQSYFSGSAGNLVSLEKLSRKYTAAEEPILGTRIYSCTNVWQVSASSSDEYFCPDKDSVKKCDSFSRDGKKCRQEKAIIGFAPLIGEIDEWRGAEVKPGRLADKRNFIEKLFGAGPKKKIVPKDFVPRESTAAEAYPIQPGETQYFKMKINFAPGSKGEFYVETIGDKFGYGLLDPWWNASWDYELPITVSYSGAAYLTDFQVSVTVDTAALITAGKMNSDCSDIRFADTNKYDVDSELSYFLEPGSCNKTYTRLWVKVPSITVNKTIYMYYGNSSASSVSSGADTFVYFNDFETSVDFNAGLLSPKRTGKSAKSGSFGLNGNAYSSLYLASRNGISSGRNLIWESWVKGESSSTISSLAGIVVGHPNGNTSNGYQAIIDTRGGAFHYLNIRKDYDFNQTLAYSDTVAVANNTWYFMQLSWRSTNVIWASLYAGSTTTSPLLTCSTTDSSYTNGEYGVAAYQIGDWDNYRIRKYASSTVSTALGSEAAIVNHAPMNPFSMAQYKQDASTLISNGEWTNQSTINLYSTSTDKDLNSINIYYQLATTSESFLTATTVPSNACQAVSSYPSCSSKVWENGSTGGGSSDWYNTSFLYRTQITVDDAQVDADLANFPVYLDLSILGSSHDFWNNVAASGSDMIVTDINNNRLPLEVVFISTSTKLGQIYFKSNLENSTSTDFYIYYGSSTASQPAADATYGLEDVWNSDYIGVWHMNVTGSSIYDSTGKGHTAVSTGVDYSAAYQARNFTIANSYMQVADAADLYGMSELTVMTWVYPRTDGESGVGDMVAKNYDDAFMARTQATQALRWEFNNTGSDADDLIAANSSYSLNTWNHFVFTLKDGTNNQKIYVQGSQVAQRTPWMALPVGNYTGPLHFGARYSNGAEEFDGYMREVRLMDAVATSTWISTEHNNLNNVAAFFSTTTEETYSAPTANSSYRTITEIPDSAAGYKWQAIACDSLGLCSNWTPFNYTLPNFRVDVTSPVFGNTLSKVASTTSSIKLGFPSAVTESNFSQYKIYYRLGSSTAPNEGDMLLGSSTDANLGSQTFNGKSSTTISGLATSTWYSFVIFAYDQAGNKASSSYISERTNRAPNISFNSAGQKANGTGAIDFSVAVTDPDGETQIRARAEYFLDFGCKGAPIKATLDETDANTVAAYGDPKVQNKNTYQIGTSTGWILTSAGANTVYFDWLSKIDFGIATGTVCFKVSLDDGRGGYRIATTSIYIDNVNPTKPGSLTYSKKTGASVTLFFGLPAHDNTFGEYRIFYRVGASGVRETDPFFSSSSDPNLGSIIYGGAATTTVTGLAPDTQYVFNIWAYDLAGNKASATTEVIATTKSVPAIASSLGQYFFDGVTAIGNDTWISQSEVNLYATSTSAAGNPITIYYNFDISADPYLTSTSTPIDACSSGTNYANCPSKIWYSSKATKANIKNIPDGSYKWQALACDFDGCSRYWEKFNVTIPNIKNDLLAPITPGPLSYNSKGATSVKLNFGVQSSDSNFNEYKIYYKQGTAGVKETDSLWSSSSAAALGFIDYDGKSSTTITGLTNGASYVFNIYAYDIFGRRSSSSIETVVNLGDGPSAAFGMGQYKPGMNPLVNGGWTSSSTVILTATSTNDLPFLTYYELIANGSTFTSATTTPHNLCLTGTSFNSCGSKIWVNGTSSADWYDSEYPFRLGITVKNSQVDGNLSNFPIYFDLARFGASNNFWSNTRKNSSGGDLLIVDSSGNRLPLEVVAISTSTKTGEIYFRATNIYESVDTDFYLYYGSSTASQPAASAQYGSQSVWSNNYNALWHMNTTAVIDSLGLSGAGTAYGGTTAVPGQLGNAADFSAVGDYVNVPVGTSLLKDDDLTIPTAAGATWSFWVYGDTANDDINEFASGRHIVASKGRSAAQHWALWIDSARNTLEIRSNGGWVTMQSTVAYNWAAGQWHYVTITYDTSDRGWNWYINGTGEGSGTLAADVDNYATGDVDVTIGRHYTNTDSDFREGSLDEIRISDIERTSTWITTEYNNQSSPQTFFSTSSEELYELQVFKNKTIEISSIPDSVTGYKWQVISCDFFGCSTNWTKFNLATPNFKVDATAPAFSNSFSGLASTTNSLKLSYPAAATETNFSQYKIFYQIGSTTPVHENATWSISSSTPGYSYLGALNFNGKSSTTITGLATGTVYSFSLWAYDQAGNKSSTTLFWDRTDRAPNTVIFNSATQRIGGGGRFDISFNVNDLDKDIQLMARLDYTAGTVCNSGALSKATLDETDANTTATYGDPKVQNKNFYQIGTSTGWITTSPGVNTVDFDWLSKNDLPAADGVYCLRLTVNDNKGGIKIATTSVYVDNVAPTPPGSLTLYQSSGASLIANFGATTTETNFRQYKIFYKAGSSGVRETDTMFGSSSDPALGSITYLSQGSTTITDLNGNTEYVFNIWAYDLYGNKASATVEMVLTTKNIPVIASSLDQYLADGITAIVNNTWISQNEINLYATSTDPDGNAITIYYQLATSTGPYITSTSTPSNVCASGVSYSNCPSRVWYSSKSVKANLKSIPDGLYKWQALACTVNGCARDWKQFDATVPNIKIDITAPTAPGPLTFNSKGATTAKLNFGAQASDVNFDEYKIYYKQGTSGVKETDSLWSSSSASFLGFINYNGKSSTTITGLTNGVSYVFNIFAYDGFGRHTSSSVEVVVNLGNGPATSFGLAQYNFNLNPLSNGGWISSSSVILSATSTNDLPFLMYYELISSSSTFTSATTTLHNVCSVGTSFNSCASKIWANGTSSADWYDPDYSYRIRITADNSQVDANLADFPVYFDLARLGASNGFWSRTLKNSTGGDLLVTDSSGNRLPLEIVTISTSTKTGEVYFRASDIYDVTDTNFYLYYGSSTASQPDMTATYGSRSVWSNEYVSVWHFNESAGSLSDSASGLVGTFEGNLPDARLAGFGTSHHFDGTGDYIQTNSGELNDTDIANFTWSVWFDADSTVSSHLIWEGDVSEEGWGSNQEAHLSLGYTSAADYIGMYFGDAIANSVITYDAFTDLASWHHAVGTFSDLNTAPSGSFYLDGSFVDSDSGTATTRGWDTAMRFGRPGADVRYFNGFMDEIRISSTTRSSTWISTEYNNQNNSGTFFSTSSEETSGNTISKEIKISSMPDSAVGYKWQVIACDVTGCARNWTKFNLTTPNFKVDTTAPTPPGQLSLISRNTNSITLGFGAPTTEANFRQYKVFYKPGTSGVEETDLLYGSSTDANLGYINYNNKSSFTIGDLNPDTQYVFNIWAYDQVGNKASSTSVSFQTSNALTQTYVYTNGSSNGWTNPAFAWDVTDDTYAYRSIPGNLVNDSANYLQGTANNVGVLGLSILGVELGLEGYSIDPSRINYKLVPIFSGLTYGATTTIAGSLFGNIDSDNSFYADITDDLQAPATWTWNDLINLDAKLYASNSSTSAATAYVDQVKLRVAVDAYPEDASNLQQYQSDGVTTIPNDAWLKQTSVVLKAEATDPDTAESLSLYFQYTTTSATFISSTTEPANACVTGTSYAGCNSKVWVAAYSGAPTNFSVDPFIGTSSITAIPDGNYKWQVLACDSNGICSDWVSFNVAVPNINIDNTVPAIPGNLEFNSKTSGSVTIDFGDETTDDNFYRYRIFYIKSSTTPVTELDDEHSDSNLNFIDYDNAATTTVAGLDKVSWYTFNIWAYDLAGNKASATVPLEVKTNDGYSIQQTSYLIENDDGAGVNLNTAPGLAGVPLNNVEKGQRLNARFQVQNTGADQTYNKRFKIQYENNTDAPNSWYDVGLATPISYSYGLSGANGDLITTAKAAANGNTRVDGTWHEYTNLTNMYNLAVNNYTEFVFAVQTVNAVVGKTYRLRLIDGTGSSTFDAYTAYPTLSLVANDVKKYSKASAASLPGNSSNLTYFLDNLGYSDLAIDDSARDSLTSSAGQYPIYNFVVKYDNINYGWNASWNGQSSVAPTSNNVILQVFRFGSTNAWVTLATNNSAAVNTDFSLAGLVDYHLAEYASGGYSYWRIYQAPGAEILSSDYFVFSTTTPTAYVTGRHYRWRNDDAPYGTWREVMDTPDPTLGTVLQKNIDIRLRLSFSNTKAGNASNYGFGLQYATTTTNCSSGSFGPWTPVKSTATSTLHFQMASSAQFNNASSTSSQLSSDGYTYISGSMIEGPYSTSSAITLLEDRYTEMEFNFKATANAKDGQTYCFRGTNDGVALDAYDRYAELSVGETANAAPTFTSMPSDTGSATNTPTAYGQNVTFQATSTDADGDEYYLAVCRTNSILPSNGGAPTCPGGSWCISGQASSTKGAVCTYNTNSQYSESLDWYAFACDFRYGAGTAKCSAMSQGTVGSPNASPFRVNHPPVFSAVSTITDFLNPGGLFDIQATAMDSDTNNTLNYYVCRANSASSTGCNGGAGNTVCSVTATSSPNPICYYQNVAPSPSGAFTYYAFVYDNFGLVATSSPRTSTYNINNTTPVIGTPSLNGGGDITLNIKGAADKDVLMINTSVTDQNGCQTLVSATGVVYRASRGYNCTANDNDCYQIGTSNCIISDCSGPTDAIATYTCSTSLKFFAEPTDDTTNNPWAADNWVGRFQVYDGSNYAATGTTPVEVKTNIALEVPQTNINFGSMDPGENTGTNNQSTNVVNYGNSPINNNLAGSDMYGNYGGTIAAVYIHWDLTEDFLYGDGTFLKNGGEIVTLNLVKPTSVTDVAKPIYWGIEVPATSTYSTFSGTSTFSAILDSASW